MFRTSILAVLATLAVVTAGRAQSEPWRFRWHKGRVLTYQVDQATAATEVVGGKTSETTTKLRHVKLWQVLDMDAQGTATLQMSLKSLQFGITTPRGDLWFDSADPAKGDPQLREQMDRYVGTALAVLRVDAYGRVVEVKESKHGPASRFEAELPFGLVLPAAAPQPGQGWERAYQITLEPPQGTGEKYAAVQRYVCKSVKDGAATLTLTTTLKQPPEAAADLIPLLQLLPEGELEFDAKAGRLLRATLKIEKDLTGHQGEGSSYRFRSTYVERLVSGE